ncbi:nucleoside hydrolase [Halobacillus andaensis]|uniref:Nucleoside hydrolase n=1 Tax=Halobacillus andaensis TaxID=1176239 RepID=A0A917EVY8_HALAA|nr:nucleoside hydrolase [Halobacillus andaensis]MBP2003769.1 purine nucleosidase [Halobacillus andaensis]GGF13093.1 nucleoside hydrolase [Halobacillus andaensis]
MKKVLIIADPGVDDSFAIMYALLHPEIEVVGIVCDYGNVSQKDAIRNTKLLLKIADQEDIPIILGADRPLTGEAPQYFYDIHGDYGLGGFVPDSPASIKVYPFTKMYELIDEHGKDLTVVNLSRLSTLALMYFHPESNIDQVDQVLIMGGAFHVPGNVTPLAEANIYGDPQAAKVVAKHGQNITFIPLNVSNRAIITNDDISHLTQNSISPYSSILEPIMSYYSKQYENLIPGINGAPLHDVTLFSYLLNQDRYLTVDRQVQVIVDGPSKGLTHADFRPVPKVIGKAPIHTIVVDFDPSFFVKDFIEIMS